MARVLQLVTELVVGGATLSMLDFAEDLCTEHELVIAHGRLEDPDNAAARRARARFQAVEVPHLARPLDPRSDLLAAAEVARLCRRLRPDVLHTHSSKAGAIGRLGVPSQVEVRLHTIHGWGHTPLDGAARRRALVGAERLAARRTTALIAVSPEVRDEGIALGIGRSSRYVVIGAPVDMRSRSDDFAEARAEARRSLGLPPEGEVVGWVGRFSPQKDPEVLTAVLSHLLAQRPAASAVLIGDGPARGLVEDRLTEEISAGRVRLAGLREDVRALYPAFDVLLHTSRWEGHPRVPREALAERIPVVTARVEGTSVVSTDERFGTEVTPGDTAAYLSALSAILDAPERRAPLDARALTPLRAAADEPYRSMRQLYASALAQRR